MVYSVNCNQTAHTDSATAAADVGCAADRLIIQSNDPRCLDSALVGGKASNLARLLQLGHTVPPFSVFPSALFDSFTRDEHKEALKEIVERARRQLIKQCMDSREMITPHLFAVRSSALGEDSGDQSYAGLLNTTLGAEGVDDIVDAIWSTYESLRSQRVAAYGHKNNLNNSHDLFPDRTAVILQVMLQPTVSGVLFTNNPATGERDSALIESNVGHCESVVNGSSDVDQFHLPIFQSGNDKHDGNSGKDKKRTITKKIATKTTCRLYCPKERSMTTCSIEPERQNLPTLNDKQLEQLRNLAETLTRQFKSAQDCEWSFVDETLFLLQTRPITHLLSIQPPHGEKVVWDCSNIQESYNGVTTPLSFSVASQAYAAVYEQTAKIAGAPSHLLEEAKPLFRNLIGYIHGRIYYNINNWYRCLQYAPAFKQTKKDMERMMGLESSVDFIEDQIPDRRELTRRIPLMFKAAMKLFHAFFRLTKDSQQFIEQTQDLLDSAYGKPLAAHSPTELIYLFDTLNRSATQNWSTPITNDCYVMIMNGLVARALQPVQANHSKQSEQNDNRYDDSTITELMAVETQLPSLAPANALLNLVRSIQTTPDALHALLDFDYQTTNQTTSKTSSQTCYVEILRAISPTLYTEATDFIEQYGDRFIGEQKLETITLKQNANLLVPMLKNCLQESGDLLPSLEIKSTFDGDQIQQLERDVAHHIRSQKGRIHAALFRYSLKRLRRGINQREAMRLMRTKLFGSYRSIFVELGRQWALEGLLDSPRDIFFLSWEEIFSFAEGRSLFSEWRALIAHRKEQYQHHLAIPELKRQFYTHGPIPQNSLSQMVESVTAPSGNTLQGSGCHQGVVEGEVSIVLSPEDSLDLRDKILVARRTDPGWTPLFLGVKAVIVEHGSMLSHSAIIARELGIPTIVNVPHVTSILNSGDTVHLDGKAGKITIINRVSKTTEEKQ